MILIQRRYLLHNEQIDKAGVDYFSGHLTIVAKMGQT